MTDPAKNYKDKLDCDALTVITSKAALWRMYGGVSDPCDLGPGSLPWAQLRGLETGAVNLGPWAQDNGPGPGLS